MNDNQNSRIERLDALGLFAAVEQLTGSSWAVLDDRFYAIVDELFDAAFCDAADALLAANDTPGGTWRGIGSPHRERALAAAMRRHPSHRR